MSYKYKSPQKLINKFEKKKSMSHDFTYISADSAADCADCAGCCGTVAVGVLSLDTGSSVFVDVSVFFALHQTKANQIEFFLNDDEM